MRVSSFAEAAREDGAAALNRVFQEYLIPVAFSTEQLHLHISYNDVDVALSPIWYDDAGAVLAAALLAVRDTRGWIGGFGVAPEYRGKGYAKRLLDSVIALARERGLTTLQLEVLSENAPAIALYCGAGFKATRSLISVEATIAEAQLPRGFAYAPVDEFIEKPQSVAPGWQRESASLRNGAASTAVSDGNGTYALFRHNAALAQVLKLQASSSEKFAALAQGVATGYPSQRVMLLNEPEESPLLRFAQEAGWTQRFFQYEMRLAVR